MNGRSPKAVADAANAELGRRRALARHVGGPAAVDRAHRKGLLTAPERIRLLIDPGSEQHFGELFHSDDLARVEETFGDGELCGFGTIEGRPVSYLVSDPRVKGASSGLASLRKAEYFRNIVEKGALPLFYLMQGGGARIDDLMTPAFIRAPGTGLGARRLFSRRGPGLAGVLGAYYAPWNVAHADFSVMTEGANLSLTSPPLVQAGTGLQVTAAELGGVEVHTRGTGQVDAVAADEPAAIALLHRVFSYLPGNAAEAAPRGPADDPVDRACPELYDLVPDRMAEAYDVKRVIGVVVDRDSFFEYSSTFAANMVTGLARMGGQTIAVMANQPRVMAGVVDSRAVVKARKLLELCKEFNLPLLSLVDTPGVLPTPAEEGRRLMAMLYEHGVTRLAPRVPKVVVILRKAIGFALHTMSAGDPEAVTFVWPNSQIAFTGPEACARVVHRTELEAAADPDALLADLVRHYSGTSAPWSGARLGYLDDIIDPAETRSKVARALEVTRWQG